MVCWHHLYTVGNGPVMVVVVMIVVKMMVMMMVMKMILVIMVMMVVMMMMVRRRRKPIDNLAESCDDETGSDDFDVDDNIFQ